MYKKKDNTKETMERQLNLNILQEIFFIRRPQYF